MIWVVPGSLLFLPVGCTRGQTVLLFVWTTVLCVYILIIDCLLAISSG